MEEASAENQRDGRILSLELDRLEGRDVRAQRHQAGIKCDGLLTYSISNQNDLSIVNDKS